MDRLLAGAAIGVVAGIVDIAPMLARRMSRRAMLSAFLQYFFAAIVIVNIDLPGIVWWLEGGLLAFALALPVIVLVSEKERNAPYVIGVNALVLGTLIGLAGHWLV